MIIQRHFDYAEIKKRLSTYRVTALLGTRQSGKTTLARQFQANHYFDLENPQDFAQFQNPQLTFFGGAHWCVGRTLRSLFSLYVSFLIVFFASFKIVIIVVIINWTLLNISRKYWPTLF